MTSSPGPNDFINNLMHKYEIIESHKSETTDFEKYLTAVLYHDMSEKKLRALETLSLT